MLIATGIFILILLIGILAARKPYVDYKRDLSMSAKEAASLSATISPEDASALLQAGAENVLLIDIRSIYDYDKGHPENAIHIPKIDLLDRENIKSFRKAASNDKTIILCGADHLDGTGPCMLLRDIGLDNVKVLEGGYASLNLDGNETIPSDVKTRLETPKYNYSEMVGSQAATDSEPAKGPAPEVILPVRKAKSKAEGGC